jgi:hypothetical protein
MHGRGACAATQRTADENGTIELSQLTASYHNKTPLAGRSADARRVGGAAESAYHVVGVLDVPVGGVKVDRRRCCCFGLSKSPTSLRSSRDDEMHQSHLTTRWATHDGYLLLGHPRKQTSTIILLLVIGTVINLEMIIESIENVTNNNATWTVVLVFVVASRSTEG